MASKKISLTCILPTHNEGESIFDTLVEIDNVLSELCELSVYVSEDGSSDNTRAEVERASAFCKNSNIRLSETSGRLGYSKAVQKGIANTSTEYVCFMDSDGQCDPKDIIQMLELAKPGYVITGVRTPRNDSLNRRIFSYAFGIAYRMHGFPKLSDPSSPLIMAKTSDIQYLSNVPCRLDYGYWWEFQARIAAKNLKVIEIPITHRVRAAGVTQVYRARKLPKIVTSHLHGLRLLKADIKGISD